MYNFDDFAAYHGTALAMRDRLLVAWNETHQTYATKDPKRIYCKILFDLWLIQTYRWNFLWVELWIMQC